MIDLAPAEGAALEQILDATTRPTSSVARCSGPPLDSAPTIALGVERDHKRILCQKSVSFSRRLMNRPFGLN